MFADIITFGVMHPFVAGMITGGFLFGGALGILGWCCGYDYAMRKVGGWMRAKRAQTDEAYGDMPTLPPTRDRRHIATTPGRWV